MKKLLHNGGELFVNRLGKLWIVDVFDAGPCVLRFGHTGVCIGDEGKWVADDHQPIYHAAYDNEADAAADAERLADYLDKLGGE